MAGCVQRRDANNPGRAAHLSSTVAYVVPVLKRYRGCIQRDEESCYTSLRLPIRRGDENCDISALCRSQLLLSRESKACRPEDLGYLFSGERAGSSPMLGV